MPRRILILILLVAAYRSALAVEFRDFNGVVYLPPAANVAQLGVGWAREPFDWNAIEPQKGRWDWTKTDALLANARAANVQILPLLGYTAKWGSSTPGQETAPPANPQAWVDFVTQVVTHYTAPPYNVQYFEVWNEPTAKALFWRGTNEQFIDLVYIPAAKVIREHGARVVFGGWPLSNSLAEFDSVLNYHQAWRWTDIVNVHYFGDVAWQPLYGNWVANGKCKGVWQTEVGFSVAPTYLPNFYLRTLNWALRTGWREPDQFKVFWYAWWGTGANGDKCLLKAVTSNQSVLTAHGQRLSTLVQIFAAGPLSAFTQFSSTPALPATLDETQSTALGFKVGPSRVMLAFLLDRRAYANVPSIPVNVTLAAEPKIVQLVTATGTWQPLPSTWSSGTLQLTAPLAPALAACPACAQIQFYLQFDLPGGNL
jgi:hypothetical protein